MTTVIWNAEAFAQLRKAYDAADRSGLTEFEVVLKGYGPLRFHTQYAMYLIEYLESLILSPPHPAQKSREGEESYVPGSGSWEGGGLL